MSDQVCLLVRRKLVLIGIATIIICATLYTIVKWRSDDSAEAAEAVLVARGATGAPEISVQSSELWLTTPYFKIFCVLSSVVVLLACATSASVILDGKKAVEAERVLRELCRNTKSDASLAIPVAPIARIRINPFDIVKSCLLARRRCPDVGQDSDCLDIDWVPPVGCGATDYHLQWREQPEQEPTEWASSVASEKIGVPCCTKGSLRTHTPYQFRVRAFSAVSERWGPWSPPSEPQTVRPGKVLPPLLSLARPRAEHASSHPPTTTGPTFHRLTSPFP